MCPELPPLRDSKTSLNRSTYSDLSPSKPYSVHLFDVVFILVYHYQDVIQTFRQVYLYYTVYSESFTYSEALL